MWQRSYVVFSFHRLQHPTLVLQVVSELGDLFAQSVSFSLPLLLCLFVLLLLSLHLRRGLIQRLL